MDENWLVNKIVASVGDDFYLDRGEEQRIKEDSATKGLNLADVERVLRREMDRLGAAHERLLVDELELLLHQYTDKDRYLDAKEEENVFQKITTPAAGKKKALDPRVARTYVDDFCVTHGVKRASDVRRRNRIMGLVAVFVLGAAGIAYAVVSRKPEVVVEQRVVEKTVTVETNPAVPPLATEEKSEIDGLLVRAAKHVDQAEYTDPPERSAKACLDRIRAVDPTGQYRATDVRAVVDRIVDEYLKLADRDFGAKETESAQKWIDRARLFNKNSELIRERERKHGLVAPEK